MSTKSKKPGPSGKRYTDAEKQAVVDFVNDHNAKNGRGGQSAAAKKFGVSILTVSSWLKAAGVVKAEKPAKAKKPANAEKASKPAKAEKAAKAAKAPKAAKAAKAEKPAKAEKAPKAEKPAKKGGRKVPQGTRYTDEQKREVLDYVAQVNATRGRGGMSAAAKKFKITPLTIGVWVQKYGVSGGVAPEGSAKGGAGVPPKTIAKLRVQVAKAEAMIGEIKSLLSSI